MQSLTERAMPGAQAQHEQDDADTPQTETARLMLEYTDALIEHVRERIAPLAKRIAAQDVSIATLNARIDALEKR